MQRSIALAKALTGTAAVALLTLAPLAAQAGSVNLSNENSVGGTVGPLGSEFQPNTYGEVFTAPVNGTLSAFTFTFVGPIPQFQAGIAEWNGPSTFTAGAGVSAIDYETGPQSGVADSDFTFNPDLTVTAGTEYVAFITTFGLPLPPFQPNGIVYSNPPTAGIDYFVSNFGDPGDASWEYDTDYNIDLTMNAHFTTVGCSADIRGACGGVPEPAVWTMMLLGFGGAGAALRRRRARPFRAAFA
jgi:hypothetical protein